MFGLNRSIILLVLLVFLVSVPTVLAAKNVVYVQGAFECAHSALSCDCLKGNDNLFCNRLKTLGYNVILQSDTHVFTSHPWWQPDYEIADMIFLGNISEIYSVPGASRNTFCSMINNSANLATNKTNIFAAFNSVRKGATIEGCMFYLHDNIRYAAPAGKPENTRTGLYRVLREGEYITSGYNVGEYLNLYNGSTSVSVYDEEDPAGTSGFIGVDTSGGETYSILRILTDENNTNTSVFWGLGNPSNYTLDTWSIFDRTVMQVMGDETRGITGSVQTNSEIYKPNETIQLNFTTDPYVTSVSFSILPDEIIDMTKYGDIWKRSYSIPSNIANGTYTIIVTAKTGAVVSQFAKKIQIIPYDISYTLDKNSYLAGENITVSLYLANSYSDKLNYTANISIAGITQTMQNFGASLNKNFT